MDASDEHGPSADVQDSATRSVRGPPSLPRSEPEVETGDTIDRYTLLERIGAGGMGVVFAAQDPRLDRKVALKLLRPTALDEITETSTGRARLVREAQSMAKLSHPHVVEVYDVGTAGQQVFISMELVQGTTLRRWLKRTPPWREVLEVFMQAGRGLAAAHAVGLVHRDFKPDNVLVDRDDHAKVLDFGLALLQEPTDLRSSQSLTQGVPVLRSWSGDRLASHLTQAGVVMGTPAYMPPEQHLGRDVDPRADQYAFCASLYDGLFGVRPFEGQDVASLLRAKRSHSLQPPRRGAEIPLPIRRAVERGLQPHVDDRWPTMEALLDALDHGARPPRRRWVWALGGLLAAGLGASAWEAERSTTCASADERLAGVWDADRQQAVQQALLDTEVAYAEDAWSRVEHRLDDHVGRWREAHTSHCEALRQSGEASETDDRRTACLERDLRQVAAVTELLAHADRQLLPQAVPLVLDLPAPESCARDDEEDPELALPLDPAAARRATVLEGRLAEVETMMEAARYAEAERVAAQVHADARRLGHPPTIVRALWAHADALHHTGAFERAEAMLTDGVYEASAAGFDRLVVQMSASLISIVGSSLVRVEDAERWARHGEAALARVRDDGRLEATLRVALGRMLVEGNKPELGVQELSRALALRSTVFGEDALPTAEARTYLGRALYALGRYEESIPEYEQVLGVQQRLLGPDHPEVGMTLIHLANALYQLGRHDEARAHREHVYRVMVAALGPDHPYVGDALHSLGNSAVALRNLEDAVRYYRGAMQVRGRALGPEAPAVAASMVNLGVVLSELKRYDEALIQLRRAEDRLERTVGEEHVWTAACRTSIANLLFDQEHYDEAAVEWKRAVVLRERLHGPDHPAVAFARRGLGETLLEMGRAADAVAQLESALAIQGRGNTAPDDLAGTQFLLARALVDAGRERERALQLADEAEQGLGTRPERMKDELEDLARWRARHR